MKRQKTREQLRFEEDAEILAGIYASRLEAEAILEMRRRGMIYKDLAGAMFVSQPNLTKILTSANPRLTTIVKLAMALDADLALTWNGVRIEADLIPDPESEPSGEPAANWSGRMPSVARGQVSVGGLAFSGAM